MPAMGTVLQESTVQNSQNKLVSSDRAKSKALGHAASKKTTKAPVLQPPNIYFSSEPEGLGRIRPDAMLIMANPTNRQHNMKLKSQATSKNGQKERRQKQNTNSVKDSEDKARSLQRKDLSDCRTKDEGRTIQSKAGEEDSASDLSDSERYSVLPARISPPDLNLRAEIVDPTDLHPSKPSCRRHNFRGGYPDFLPPPFNSWSLKQLAVYLNTDGKAIPRPKPVGQLERYLDRLLQMEWHQIQTLQEDSSKSNTSAPKGRHSTSHLSSPKCILQCQRAFPLALLSSLTTSPTLQLSRCTCPHGHTQYPNLNGSCRSYTYHHHTRLCPVVEKRASRSSSESRAHQCEARQRTREHRLSDPLSESRHLRHMQAVGNIRNPVGSTYCPDQVPSADTTGKKQKPGRRSHSCAGTREAGFRSRGRCVQRKTQPDSTLSSAESSDGLRDLKEPVPTRLTRKQKHVEFITQ